MSGLLGSFNIKSWVRLGARLKKLENKVNYLIANCCNQEAGLALPIVDFIVDKFDRADADTLGSFWGNNTAFVIRGQAALPRGSVTDLVADYANLAAAGTEITTTKSVTGTFAAIAEQIINFTESGLGSFGDRNSVITRAYGGFTSGVSVLRAPFIHTAFHKSKLRNADYKIKIKYETPPAVLLSTQVDFPYFGENTTEKVYETVFNPVSAVWRYDAETRTGQFCALAVAELVGLSYTAVQNRTAEHSAVSLGACFASGTSSYQLATFSLNSVAVVNKQDIVNSPSFVAGWAFFGSIAPLTGAIDESALTLSVSWANYTQNSNADSGVITDPHESRNGIDRFLGTVCDPNRLINTTFITTQINTLAQWEHSSKNITQTKSLGLVGLSEMLIDCVGDVASVYIDGALIQSFTMNRVAPGSVALQALQDVFALTEQATAVVSPPKIHSFKVWTAATPEPSDTAESGYGTWDVDAAAFVYTAHTNIQPA